MYALKRSISLLLMKITSVIESVKTQPLICKRKRLHIIFVVTVALSAFDLKWIFVERAKDSGERKLSFAWLPYEILAQVKQEKIRTQPYAITGNPLFKVFHIIAGINFEYSAFGRAYDCLY